MSEPHSPRPLLHASDVEVAAAARAGDGALAWVGLAEAWVVGEEVLVYGPVGDLLGADGTEDGFGHVEYGLDLWMGVGWSDDGTGHASRPPRA